MAAAFLLAALRTRNCFNLVFLLFTGFQVSWVSSRLRGIADVRAQLLTRPRPLPSPPSLQLLLAMIVGNNALLLWVHVLVALLSLKQMRAADTVHSNTMRKST